MKLRKYLLAVLACLLFVAPVMADDDLMITRDGAMTPVKIERISSSQVTYVDLKHKKSGSQNVSTTFVYMIMKEKGNNIFFDEEGNQTTAPAKKIDKKDNVLFLNKGDMIVVYNISISKEEITYQMEDKKKAPWIKTKKSDVFMIRNSDGTTTLFYEPHKEKQNASTSNSSSVPAAGAAVMGASASATNNSGLDGKHMLGDIVVVNGVKGMVFKTDGSGEHGLVMTIQKCEESWLKDKDAKFETGAFYEDDGEKNLAAIANYIKEQNQQWEDFPYFNWCRKLGDGWYPPANEELTALIKFINGEGMKYTHKNAKKIHEKLKDAGGDGIYDGFTKHPYLYFSSTEAENGWVYVMIFDESLASAVTSGKILGGGPKGKYSLKPYLKSQMGGKFLNIVGNRAVHKF